MGSSLVPHESWPTPGVDEAAPVMSRRRRRRRHGANCAAGATLIFESGTPPTCGHLERAINSLEMDFGKKNKK